MARRVFQDGQDVTIKKTGRDGTIIAYRKGKKFPYVVESSAGKSFHSYKGLKRPGTVGGTRVAMVVVKETKEKKNMFNTIRDKVRELAKSEEQRLFERYGVTDDTGALTEVGRQTVLDKLFEDAELRAVILRDVKAIDEADAEKKSTRKK